MKLFKVACLVGLSAVQADSDSCPSDECWEWNDGTETCDLKESASGVCDYSVTCSHGTGMALKFNNALFGSEASSEFNDASGATCDPEWSAGSDGSDGQFEWTQPLGACGQTLTRKDDQIIFTKTITLGGNSDDGIPVGTGALKLYTSSDVGGVSVTFKCKFDSTATAKSAELSVKQRVAVSGTAAEATGIWDNSMTLKYYEDSSYTTEMALDKLDVFIGSDMFVRSSWTVTTLADSLRYYISECTVREVDTQTSVAIVDETCYASAVGAEPLNSAALDSPTGKIVESNSDFKYKSFSFGSNGAGRQELECTVNFCIVRWWTDFDGITRLNDEGESDCGDIVHATAVADGSKQCPATPGFNFVAGR